LKKLEAELNFHKSQTKNNAKMGFMRGLVEIMQE